MKRIVVLTSGGDAPGMNAALRAVTRKAINENIEVYGANKGYNGLLEGDFVKLNRRDVSDIVQRGGTKLKTARSDTFNTKEGVKKAYKVMQKHKIDAVFAIGGDGTMRGCKDLYEICGAKCFGIPATIDNDFQYTDFTIGFDTAGNTILKAINNLRDTMISHDRISIVEVMGRRCGDLALTAGIAGGAEIILVPEVSVTIDTICKQIQENRENGKSSEIIVLAEGFCKAEKLKADIEKKIGIKVWTTILGHIQRGGAPTLRDRFLAAQFGVRAVELFLEGKTNRLVGIKDNKIIDMDTSKALSMKRVFDKQLYKEARIISL